MCEARRRAAFSIVAASAWLSPRCAARADDGPPKRTFEWSVQASRGLRPYMEDARHVSADGRFAAVYDGHGGPFVSQYLHQHLFANVQNRLDAEPEDQDLALTPSHDMAAIERALRGAFRAAADAIAERAHWNAQGSTAAVVLVGDDALVSANVGDSRAVLSRRGRAVCLTRDHKPDAPDERARIEALGGAVEWEGARDPETNEPVAGAGCWRVNGALAVSRVIGDQSARPFVTDEVEILAIARERAADEFVVVATDGLWDVMSSAEAVEFVHECTAVGAPRRGNTRLTSRSPTRGVGAPAVDGDGRLVAESPVLMPGAKASPFLQRRKQQMARYLMEEAMRRGTTDNITIIVLWLK